MKESGIITDIMGKQATINTIPAHECKGCKSCGSAKPREVKVNCDNILDFSVNDKVCIEVADNLMIKLCIYLYGIPLVIFVSIVIGIYFLTSSPALSFGVAIAFLAAFYLLFGKILSRNAEIRPRITKI